METFEVSYVYRRSEQEDLENLIDQIEREVGGKRETYDGQAGALDLVTVLEFVLLYCLLKPITQKYFEGLFNAEALKELGEEHRNYLATWFLKVEDDISRLVHSIQASMDLLQTTFTLNGAQQAIAIEIPTKEGTLSVVINHQNISPRIIKNLPRGIVKAIRYVSENGVPDRCIGMQLYFDKESANWKYLFVPSLDGPGRWIDRYIDLESGDMMLISSQTEFIEIFQPEREDQYKFLVSPFRDIEHEE